MSQCVSAVMSEKTWGTRSCALILSQRLLRLVFRVRSHAWTMLCARAVKQWKIRPKSMSALRGIRHSRAVVWQRVRGVARACRNGAGYRRNYNDPIQEEQEMVCLEVWMVSIDFPNASLTLVVSRWASIYDKRKKIIKFLQSPFSVLVASWRLFLFASYDDYLL